MRVATAFNKMLAIVGASVTGVTFGSEGVVVGLRRRQRRLVCPCGYKTWAVYDRSLRRWRHLDLGATKLWLEAEIRRLECRRCHKVRTEVVPWARAGARHSRDFQDVVAWLAQRTDKTTITKLLRVSWEAVARIVVLVVAEDRDDSRLDGLVRIGVDEISYRAGHRFLTVVADHDRGGAVVWAADGRHAQTLTGFYDTLGAERTARLEAISLDMGGSYKYATDQAAPHVVQCVDPFHVVKLVNGALNKARQHAWNDTRRQGRPEPGPLGRVRNPSASWIAHTRWALLKDPDHLTPNQLEILHTLRRTNSVLYRSWQLKEGMRDLYRLADPADAPRHLAWWLNWASHSQIPSFVATAKTIRTNRDRILAAVELNLSNSKLEGLNSKIRLINHRGYGHHSATAIIAMIYLCCGGLNIELPLK